MTAQYVKDIIQKAYEEKAPFLALGNCGLREIPEEIAMLAPFLRKLNLGPYYNIWDQQINSTHKGSTNRFIGNKCGFERLLSCNLLDTLYANDVSLNAESCKDLAVLGDLRMLELYGNKLSDEGAAWIGQLEHLSFLDISSNHLTGEGAEALSGLVHLSSLHVKYNNLGWEGAAAIGRLSNLTTLSIRGCQLFDEGAEEIGNLGNLISLDINVNQIGSDGLVAISRLHQLITLDVSHNEIGDKGLAAISSLANLTSLYVYSTELTDKAAKVIAGFEQLTSLSIGNNKLSDKAAKAISSLGKLTYLNIGHNKLTTEGVCTLGCLGNLTNLRLSSIPLTDQAAEAIGNLHQLTALEVFNAQLTDRGAETIARLDQLHTLYAANNQLTAIGAMAISRLANLTTLHIHDNQLGDEGAEAIANLHKLSVLSIYRNQLTDRGAEALGRLSKLTILQAGYSQFTGKGMEAIAQLRHLSKLHLTHSGITDEGVEAIARLENLTNLSLSNNQITGRGAVALSQLKNLQDLWIEENQLGDEGAAALSRLAHLRALVINENQLTDKGTVAISGLRHLHVLFLGGNQLSDKGVTTLGQLSDLFALDISNNKITDDGAKALGQLPYLENLYINENQVSDEGARALSALPRLESIQISNNRITDKGVEALLTCPLLRNISFRGNEILSIPEEITYSVEAMRAYFSSTQRVDNTLVKMILVGNTTAGKSTLAKFLATGQYDPAMESTHGIQLWKWEVREQGYDLQVNIWDFGGQDYYHATHNIFLDKKSLYLFLHVPRDIHNAVADHSQYLPEAYWLGNVDSFTNGNNTKWYIQSKADLYEPQYLDTRLSLKYNVKKDQYPVSIDKAGKSDGKDPDFQHFYRKLIGQLASLVGGRLPVSWVMIRDELLPRWREQALFLSVDKFEQRCMRALRDKPAVLEDLQKTWKGLLPYLKGCGEVVHFPENKDLREVVFLSAARLTNGIYELLSKKVKDNQGIFTLHTLQQGDRKHAELYLKVLLAFGLVFERPGSEGVYVVPQYLPENPGTLHLMEYTQVGLAIHFPEYMSRSLITRFLVTYAAQLTENDYWRYGASLKLGNTPVWVRIDATAQKVYIYTPKEDYKNWYAAVKELLLFFAGQQQSDNTIADVPGEIELSLNGDDFASINTLREGIDNQARKVKSVQGRDIIFNEVLLQLLGNNTTLPKKIFISYSHKDEVYKDELDKHFAAMNRSGKTVTWHDRQIKAGENWDATIKKALHEADIMLLLLSPDFMASDYIWDVEIPAAIKKGVTIVLVFVRHCYFKEDLFKLHQIQGFPRDARWIVNNHQPHRDEAWLEVVLGIKAILDT